MKKALSFLLVIVLFSSCKTDSESDNEIDIDLTKQSKMVDYKITTYRLKTFDIPQSLSGQESYLPQKFELYLYPSTSIDSLKLGTDVSGKLIKEEFATDLGMPANALFYVRSYYAGGGNIYYGMLESEEFVVYKGYEEEPIPNVEPSAIVFRKQLTARIYPDSINAQY